MRRIALRWRLAGVACVAVVSLAAPLPAHAARGAGVGEAGLNVAFALPGIPALPGLCAPVSFSVAGGSQVAAIALADNVFGTAPYVGPVSITGGGSSPCAGVPVDQGNVSLAVNGASSLSGSVSCSFSGQYVRFGGTVLAEMTGPCNLNGTSEPTAGIVVMGALRPTSGDGVTSNITQAHFDGAYALEG